MQPLYLLKLHAKVVVSKTHAGVASLASCIGVASVARVRPLSASMAMEPAEIFVNYIQAWIPTFVVRLLVRWYIRLFVGWRMRSADVVVQQIKLDRKERVLAPVTKDVEITNEQV